MLYLKVMGVSLGRRQKTDSPSTQPAGCRTLCADVVRHAGGLPARAPRRLLWDDNMHVTRADLRSLHGLWRIWFDLGATQQYYPLLHSAFWLEHRIWGDAVLGYHLTNVVLHAASACLVVLIVRRLALPGAWLAGFLFALHPVCVEAVAWISEQKSTLSGVFYLAAALTYLHFDRTRRKSQYFLALALFVLALMSKSVTATLPAVLLVVFWWQRGRLEWRRDVLPLAAMAGRGRPAGLFTAWVESTPRLIGAQGAQYALTLAAASAAGRPRAVVLRLEGALAVEPDVYLSSLEDRSRPVGGNISSRWDWRRWRLLLVCWRGKTADRWPAFSFSSARCFPCSAS